MVRLLILVMGLVAVTSLSACGESCEDLQDQFEQITMEIAEAPDTVLDRADDMDEISRKIEENGCLDR